MAKLFLTGDKKLDATLKRIASEHGVGSVNAAARVGTREIAKDVLTEAKAQAPHDTGRLEETMTVRSLKKARTRFGHTVIHKLERFEETGFYGGYVEYGTKFRAPDPYMRPALYGNETGKRAKFLRIFWANLTKRLTP